jgi:uncharacterized protein
VIGDPGEFCWIDIKTQDVPATQHWFDALLGWRWSVDETDWRQATKARCDHRPVASISDLSSSIYPVGLPDHVAAYLRVTDLELTAADLLSRGATSLIEPFDAGDQGRVSTMVDPWGAPFSLWEADDQWVWQQPPSTGAPHRLLLLGTDAIQAGPWYRDGHGIILEDAEPITAPGPPRWVPLIGLSDPAAAVAAARRLGAGVDTICVNDGGLMLVRSPGGIEIALEPRQVSAEPS